MRIVVYREQDNFTVPEAFGSYSIRSVDRRDNLVRQYSDRNLFSVSERHIEKPMVILLTEELLSEKLVLQFSAFPKFKKPQISVGIMHNNREELAATKTVPLQFNMQLLNPGVGKSSTITVPSEKVEMTGNFVTTFISNFNISVEETASLMVSFLPITGFTMLADVQLFYNPAALMVKNQNRHKYRGRLILDGEETQFMEFKIYCLESLAANLTIDMKFVGDITYRKQIAIECAHSHDLAKDLRFEHPQRVNSPRVRMIPLAVSEAIGSVEVQSFEAPRLNPPVSYVRLVAPATRQGQVIDYRRPAYLEFGCSQTSGSRAQVAIVTGQLKAMNRVFKIESEVSCEEEGSQATSLLLTLGTLLYIFVAIPLAVLAATHFYGRVKDLKERKATDQRSQMKRVVEMVQQGSDSINFN